MLLILTASAASPQRGQLSVAVAEFSVAVGGQPADLGLMASRLAATALEATGAYQVIDSLKVEEQVRERRLRPPFGVGHLQLLADVLDADLIVHGSIRGVTYDAEAGSASVVAAAEVVDGPSGALKRKAEASGFRAAQTDVAVSQREAVIGALAAAMEELATTLTGRNVRGAAAEAATAETAAQGGLSEARLPEMAAAGDAPKLGPPRRELAPAPSSRQPTTAVASTTPVGGGELTPPAEVSVGGPTAPETPPTAAVDGEVMEGAVPLVEAKVLAKLGPDRVLITLGRDAGVAPKMELDVYRLRYSRETDRMSRSRIGRIRVVKLNPTDAEARILEGAELMRTGDLAYYYGE